MRTGGEGGGTLVPTYDRLANELAQWRGVGYADPSAVAEAESVVRHEARLLDDHRMAEWLELWAADGALWVPLDPDAHPALDQSFYLDDVRRLHERVAWAEGPSAWSQHPRPLTVRLVSNVEALAHDDGALSVRSSLVLAEHRGGRRQDWAGHQFHRFGPPRQGARGGARPITLKILVVPSLRSACRHPGVLL
ncbi:MAG: aromatic-ring-hydroxylating dioxygenase subunit beta [Actinomycetota bacterium]|nr:aromatic-ring-hydroxylating dioxygenase subunit beta [Actinomycetota bacterium]